ncbi:AMP-binding enzyme family [Cordyceps militaris]|uniref:AMP-binding enzyme family n=1 Tax=Cordyceps militaris TaxID=73501 RepID=A0A2H4S869_CORMI|nr:AMP-binding enzyme family [Cordyceps militaris]
MSAMESCVPAPPVTAKSDLAEIHGGPATGFGQLLWHMFLATATKYPGRDAIVAINEEAGPPENSSKAPVQRWSYRELLSKVDAVAHRLGHLGCGGNGNTLVVITRNIAEWGLFFWVAAKLGMTFIPLDPGAKGDLSFLLSASSPQLLFVEDEAMAQAVEDWVVQTKSSVQAQIILSDTTRAGWLSLVQIEAETHRLCLKKCQFDDLRANNTDSNALIIFTSGTTGTPKACLHTHDNLVSQTHDYDPNPDPEFVDRWLIHTPVHHIFAINNALRAWRLGGAVILPSPTFSVRASLGAVVREQCTIMSATPTLIRAMLAESSCPDVSEFNLSIISLASTVISPEDIRLCKQSLGCRHAIQAYGMSETGPVVSWSRQEPLLVDGFHPGVGKVLPGASIRVCQPGTHDILCIGDVGELHVSGSSVIDSYLDPGSNGSFYVEGERRWLVTGDQARIDEDGVVYILGRYKDLIIRGGEKIDPATIESAISALPKIEVQVVGQADKIAGEVPVAIVKRTKDTSNSSIFEKARSLGPKYTLGAIYDLSQLGYEEMPVTSLKKPRRQLLKAALTKFIEERENHKARQEQDQDVTPEQSVVAEKLAALLEELCGVRPQPRQSVDTFTDSILLLQYCDRVFRFLHVPLYLQDLTENKDILSQAALVLQRRSGKPLIHAKPPMASYGGQNVPRERLSLKVDCRVETCSTVASALPTGVMPESVMPLRASQYRLVEGQRPQSYHIRLGYRIQQLSGAQIMERLQILVSKTPLLRSLLVKEAAASWQHVVCGDSLASNLLHERDAPTEDEAKRSLMQESLSALQRPYAFRADLIRCRDTDSHVLVLHFNHAIVDALSLWSTLRNLDDLLRDPAAQLPDAVPYRLWADLWQQNRRNELARAAVAHLAGRLRGISRFPGALWPPQHSGGWMVGDDSGAASQLVAARTTGRDAVWNGGGSSSASPWAADEFRFPRRGRIVRLPHLSALRAAHGIAPEVLARCALVLLNVAQTRAPYAVFVSWEAARAWPFVPAWMQAHLPPAMAVDGPTTQWRLNMYAAPAAASETVLAFLQRMRDDEAALAEHGHAPWDDVKAALGDDEAGVAEDASFRQGFVWDMTLGMSAQSSRRHTSYSILEPISRHDWPDCGIFWNAFMVDQENMYFIASWDTAQLNGDEVDGYCDCLAEMLRQLANTSNWNRLLRDVLPLL